MHLFIKWNEFLKSNQNKARIKNMIYSPSKITDVHSKKSRNSIRKYPTVLIESGLLSQYGVSTYLLERQRTDRHEISYLFGLLQKNHRTPPYFFHTTSTTSNLKKAFEMYEYSGFDILTGYCLFGTKYAKGMLSNGDQISLVDPTALTNNDNTINKLQIREGLSYYELEKIDRFHDLYLGIGQKELPNRFFYYLPKHQYLFYLLELYEQNSIELNLLSSWYKKVNIRSNQMERMIHTKSTPLEMQLANSSLDTVSNLFASIINKGITISIEEVLHRLSNTCDIWQAFIQTKELDKSFHGWNWQLLGFLSYSVSFMQLARNARLAKRLLIHTDDPIEATIINEASRLQKTARTKLGFDMNETIVGLYLLQHHIIANENIDSNFYTSIVDKRQLGGEYENRTR